MNPAVLYWAVPHFLTRLFERKYHPYNQMTHQYHCSASRQLSIQSHGSGNLPKYDKCDIQVTKQNKKHTYIHTHKKKHKKSQQSGARSVTNITPKFQDYLPENIWLAESTESFKSQSQTHLHQESWLFLSFILSFLLFGYFPTLILPPTWFYSKFICAKCFLKYGTNVTLNNWTVMLTMKNARLDRIVSMHWPLLHKIIQPSMSLTSLGYFKVTVAWNNLWWSCFFFFFFFFSNSTLSKSCHMYVVKPVSVGFHKHQPSKQSKTTVFSLI